MKRKYLLGLASILLIGTFATACSTNFNKNDSSKNSAKSSKVVKKKAKKSKKEKKHTKKIAKKKPVVKKAQQNKTQQQATSTQQNNNASQQQVQQNQNSQQNQRPMTQGEINRQRGYDPNGAPLLPGQDHAAGSNPDGTPDAWVQGQLNWAKRNGYLNQDGSPTQKEKDAEAQIEADSSMNDGY